MDEWRPGAVPTNVLRIWFSHDPAKREDFRACYRSELSASGKREELGKLAARAKRGTVTLLFGARYRERNNALVIQEVLEEHS